MRKLLPHLFRKYGGEGKGSSLSIKDLEQHSPYHQNIRGIHPGESQANPVEIISLPPHVPDPKGVQHIPEESGEQVGSATKEYDEWERMLNEASKRWSPEDLAGLKTPDELEKLAEEAGIADDVRHLLRQHHQWYEEATDLHGRLENDYAIQRQFRNRGDGFAADKMQPEIDDRERLILELGLTMMDSQHKIERRMADKG